MQPFRPFAVRRTARENYRRFSFQSDSGTLKCQAFMTPTKTPATHSSRN